MPYTLLIIQNIIYSAFLKDDVFTHYLKVLICVTRQFHFAQVFHFFLWNYNVLRKTYVTLGVTKLFITW